MSIILMLLKYVIGYIFLGVIITYVVGNFFYNTSVFKGLEINKHYGKFVHVWPIFIVLPFLHLLNWLSGNKLFHEQVAEVKRLNDKNKKALLTKDNMGYEELYRDLTRARYSRLRLLELDPPKGVLKNSEAIIERLENKFGDMSDKIQEEVAKDLEEEKKRWDENIEELFKEGRL